MIYAARQLVEARVTVAAINTQITALNTALSVSATALASRINGLVEAPQDKTSFPLLSYQVGLGPAGSEMKFSAKRDTGIPVRLLYVSRHATLASGLLDIEIALEAMQTVIEDLTGRQHGSTSRYCVDVTDPEVELVTYKVSDEVTRHGGELRFTMRMRTEGL